MDNEGPEEERIGRERRRRNWAIALILGGLVILFFVMTIVRLGGHVVEMTQ
ncbi:MAG TPA: hypothetical protein VGG36_01155 [Rhizomicrobium sp.]|jgi:hypothetical protein